MEKKGTKGRGVMQRGDEALKKRRVYMFKEIMLEEKRGK